MSEFTGKRAVITGGGRGIDRACARPVAQRDAAVLLMGSPLRWSLLLGVVLPE
jgi:NAD(P)-dependent dehydrogenase (short-subunit alcohol dehydrogenase family)